MISTNRIATGMTTSDDQLERAVAVVCAMSRAEFYWACEAIGLPIQEARTSVEAHDAIAARQRVTAAAVAAFHSALRAKRTKEIR